MFTLVVGGAASRQKRICRAADPAGGRSAALLCGDDGTLWRRSPARALRGTASCARKSGSRPLNAPLAFRGAAACKGRGAAECLSNLAANELYSPRGAGGEQAALAAVVDGVESLRRQCEALVVVTGEVFSGGSAYAGDTGTYLRVLAAANRALAARADAVCEVACGLPRYYKGEGAAL